MCCKGILMGDIFVKAEPKNIQIIKEEEAENPR
jgi:hypothetical protein